MKAILNGALHLSELDGWWDEAYRPDLGWALGMRLSDNLADHARDAAEADQLVDLLEHDVIPMFFARDAQDMPREWLERVKRSIAVLAPQYSAERMVAEYAMRMYPSSSGDQTGASAEKPGYVQSPALPSME
jgi:starch phosphorylase